MVPEITGYDPAELTSADLDALGDEAPGVRAQAALLLAMLPEPPPGVVVQLRKQVSRDTHEFARASAVLALGFVEARRRSVAQVAALEKLTGCNSEAPRPPPLGVRLAAILALAWVRPFEVSQEMVDLLRAHADLTVDATVLPWNAGDVGSLITPTLVALDGIDIDEALAEMARLMRAHPHQRPGGWPSEVCWPWRRLLERVLAPLGRREHDMATWSELDDAQRCALRFGHEHGLSLRMSRAGFDFVMPSWDLTFPTRRRYLGLSAPGPLDAEIEVLHDGEVHSLPIWKWFRRLSCDGVAPGALRDALVHSCSAAELVELARDATTMAYATIDEGDDDPSPRSLMLCELLDGLPSDRQTPDVHTIRATLHSIGTGDMWKMQEDGWKGGPYLPKGRRPRG